MGGVFEAEVRYSTRPEHTKRPDSGRFDTGQSTLIVQLWTPPNRPEQTKRPESGHPNPVQSIASVQFLDAVLSRNCVVF